MTRSEIDRMVEKFKKHYPMLVPPPLNSNRRGMCVLTEEEVKQLWANVWNEQPQTYSLICSPEMKRQILMTPKERRIDRRLRKSRKRVIKSPAEYPGNELK